MREHYVNVLKDANEVIYTPFFDSAWKMCWNNEDFTESYYQKLYGFTQLIVIINDLQSFSFSINNLICASSVQDLYDLRRGITYSLEILRQFRPTS